MVSGTLGYAAVQSFTGNPFLDSLMVFSAEYLVLLVPAVLVYLWFRDPEDSVFGFSAVVAGIASTYVLGLFYFHSPPQFQGYETILTKPMENAFPSQHTAAVSSLAWPLLYQERFRLSALIFTAAAFTGIGRVYTGLHFPVDILGGVLASLIGFSLVYLLEHRIYRLAAGVERLEARIRQ